MVVWDYLILLGHSRRFSDGRGTLLVFLSGLPSPKKLYVVLSFSRVSFPPNYQTPLTSNFVHFLLFH